MTAISAPRVIAGATPFERALLHAASALDGYVASRLERRGTSEYRRADDARRIYSLTRDAAQARGAIGLLPR
jgi:hypothetical protein